MNYWIKYEYIIKHKIVIAVKNILKISYSKKNILEYYKLYNKNIQIARKMSHLPGTSLFTHIHVYVRRKLKYFFLDLVTFLLNILYVSAEHTTTCP